MQNAEGFVLKDRSVVCPDCQTVFATRVLQDLPPVCDSDPIEADLHRVLPHAGLRAALIAVCPDCGCADWVSRFGVSSISSSFLVASPVLSPSKCFAMAVRRAREQKLHALDVAYVALNGLYAARESAEDATPWLELCVLEQSRGLDPENIVVETGADHLTMAELWRQMSHFDRALEEYVKAGMDGGVPIELIHQQVQAARIGDNTPTRLAPWLVRIVFPEAAELAMSPDAEALRNPPIIIQESNPFSHFVQDETGRYVVPPPEQRPEWAAPAKFDMQLEAVMEDNGGTAYEEQVEQLQNIAELESILDGSIVQLEATTSCYCS